MSMQYCHQLPAMVFKQNPTADTEPFLDEIVVAVMGITGSGKSSFIRTVTGDDTIGIGHNLKSHTQGITAYRFDMDGVKVTLVDTPGFNDTYRTDTEVLQEIAQWMELTYKNNFKLSGLMYLHRISDPRLGGNEMNNLVMFKKLCGSSILKNVVLTSTYWDTIDRARGEEREKELMDEDGFWGDMISMGARVARYNATKESGIKLLKHFIGMGKVVTAIQTELVDDNKSILETSAGQALNEHIAALQKEYADKVNKLHNDIQQQLLEKDEDMARALEKQRNRLEDKLQRLEHQKGELASSRRQEMRMLENQWKDRLRSMEIAAIQKDALHRQELTDINIEADFRHQKRMRALEEAHEEANLQHQKDLRTLEEGLQGQVRQLQQLSNEQRAVLEARIREMQANEELQLPYNYGEPFTVSNLVEQLSLGNQFVEFLNNTSHDGHDDNDSDKSSSLGWSTAWNVLRVVGSVAGTMFLGFPIFGF